MVTCIVVAGVLLLLGLFSKKNREDKEYRKAAANVTTLGFMCFLLPPLFIVLLIIVLCLDR